MSHNPLLLTAEQQAFVRSAAASVPSRWRDRFLANVADNLMGKTITNDAVVAAVGNVRRVMILGTGAPALGDDT